MRISKRWGPSWIHCFVFAGLLELAILPADAQESPPPVLATNAPAHGTFYLLGRIPSPPFPFDPYYGLLPVYAYDGVFFVDDSQVSLMAQQFSLGGEEGGGMMLMSGPSLPPIGGGGTNNVTNLFCNTLTNFVVNYLYATNGLSLGIAQTTNPWIALTIQTATTNASYDVFGTTNMVELALPSLGRTNWTWLTNASGSTINFTWGLTNWCERYFQLGTMEDADADGLTSAYENLVLHTNPNLWDTDGDLMRDGWEWLYGLNPLANDASGDADGDGLTNLQEYFGSTNPNLADNFGLFTAVPKPGSNLP